MAAVSVRRTLLVAPVAVRVRRSPAALAADQPDGHGEDAERQKRSCGGRDGDGRREGGALPPCLDRQAGPGGELARVGDLFTRQGPARLDEPAGRDLPPAAAAKTVERDERGRRRAGFATRRPEELPAVDPLHVRDGAYGDLWFSVSFLDRGGDELVGLEAPVDQEVRARIDRRGVDPEVPEDGGGRDVEAGLGDVAARWWPGRAEVRPPCPGFVVGVGDLSLERFRVSNSDAVDDSGPFAPSECVVERDHVRVVEIRRELLNATVHAFELGGRLDRDEVRALHCIGVHADLPVGEVGRLAG